MTAERTLLVGGLSAVHDPLLAAALRGCGRKAEALHPRTDTGLRIARGLGNHGQCNPAHYAVGAVIEHAGISGMHRRFFCEQRAWLTLGSCGPCRLAAFSHEYARVLTGAGLGALPVVLLDQLAFVGDTARSSPIDPAAASALLEAIVAADVVVQVGHRLRPYATDPAEVDDLVTRTVDALVAALERRSALAPSMVELAARASRIRRDPTRVLPRVLLVGEPWTTLADGDPSYDLARRLAVFGAEVLAPTATDWLRYLIWQERQAGDTPEQALSAADEAVRALWQRLAGAAALRTELEDLDAVADGARAHYDPRVVGGSAHLEIGRALQAVARNAVHLVLSLKPFGCLPSSALSDGVLSVLLREPSGPHFLALETAGNADATTESRVEMALHAATLAAVAELDAACDRVGIDHDTAQRLLESLGDATPPSGPRVHACTAAELVRLRTSGVALGPALEPAEQEVHEVPEAADDQEIGDKLAGVRRDLRRHHA